jgi:hypothetical protein
MIPATPTPSNGISPGIPDRVAIAVNRWLGAHRAVFLTASSLFCLAVFAGYSHVRFIVADECLEVTIIRMPDLHTIWDALVSGMQLDPPVLDSGMHFLFRWFGDSLFLARVPSIVCFCMVCLCLAGIVWRYAPPVYAAAAFFIPFATNLRGTASLARPYAPLLGFSALALFCWDSIEAHPKRRGLWRAAFALSLAMALSSHFYGILLLLPLGLGELGKWIARKRLDWVTLACAAPALIAFGLWSPILRSGARLYMQHYAYKADFNTLYSFFGDMLISLPWACAILLLILVAAWAGAYRDAGGARPPLTAQQRTMLLVSAGFLLLPFCGYAGGALITGYFAPQYFLPAIFGLVLGIPLVLPWISLPREVVGLCLLASMAANGALVGARGLTGLVRKEQPYPSLTEIRRLIPDAAPDIVVSAPLHFLPLYEANRAYPENDLLYLFDRPKEVAAYGTDTPDVTSTILVGRTTARLAPFDAYVATHRHFFILYIGNAQLQQWQFPYLLKNLHARMWWLGAAGMFDVYQVDLPAVER